MSDFLDNLKNAVDYGVFNSDAAHKINKINEINETAEKFSETNCVDELHGKVNKRIEDSNVDGIAEVENIPEINSNYDERMKDIIKRDKHMAMLCEIVELHNKIEDNVNIITDLIVVAKGQIDSIELTTIINDFEGTYNNINLKQKENKVK